MQQATQLHALCGAKVTINPPMHCGEARYPLVSRTLIPRAAYSAQSEQPEDFFAASVIPEGAHLVTLVVDRHGASFVHTHQLDGVLFLVRPDFQLGTILPADSIVHAFIYLNREGCPLLGIFDATRIGGDILSNLEPLERHCRVFDMYHSAAHLGVCPPNVLYHGVYYEHSCLTVETEQLHFHASSVLRLPVRSSDLVCDSFLLQSV